MATWTELWAECTERLDSAENARRVVEQVSGRAGSSWLITMTTPAPEGASARIDEMVERLLAGEPLQYVLGEWDFRQLRLKVDRRVLIPRPETEQVVQAALDLLDDVAQPVVVDLGTGSGAIALSMALEVNDSQVHATDVSGDALDVARQNAALLPERVSGRVQFHQGSWFGALPNALQGKIDMIVSNPPYVADDDEVEDIVREWEPQNALFAGPEGLDALWVIFDEAMAWLNDRGTVVVELSETQTDAVQAMAWKAGFFSVQVGRDLAGRKRWVAAKKGE